MTPKSKEFSEGKEYHCPRCYFARDTVILRQDCPHDAAPEPTDIIEKSQKLSGDWLEKGALPAPKEPDWRVEFREKVNEVRREIDWGPSQDSPTHEFGLKTQRGDELFTITDFKNIESFIEEKIAEAYEAGQDNAAERGNETTRKAIQIAAQVARAEGFAEGFNEAIKSVEALKEKK